MHPKENLFELFYGRYRDLSKENKTPYEEKKVLYNVHIDKDGYVTFTEPTKES